MRSKSRVKTRHQAAPSADPRPTRIWLWLLVYAVAVWISFGNALHAPFEYDDYQAIRQNQTIRDATSPAVLLPPRNTPVAGRPLVNISLAVDLAITRAISDAPSDETAVFHVTNILIHLCTAALLLLLLRATLTSPMLSVENPDTVAGIIALLWLVSPIQTESVDYVIQRTELLVSLFYAATVYFAARADDRAAGTQPRRWRVAALISCVLGMLCKEVMVTAPLVVMLYARVFRHPTWKSTVGDRARRRFYSALWASSLIVIAYTIAGVRAQSAGYSSGLPWYRYLASQGWAVSRYLSLIIWPAGLTFDYGEAPFPMLRAAAGCAIVATLLAATIILLFKKRWHPAGFAGAWFFLLLAPSSSLIPIKTEIAAERRAYLASVAVIAVIVVALVRWTRQHAQSTRAAVSGLAVVALVLAVVSRARSDVYRSSEALYRDAVAKTPDNPRAYVGLGLATLQSGAQRTDEALGYLRQAASVDSNSFLAWQTIGTVAIFRGDWSAALEPLRHALRIEPGNLDAAAGMARAFLNLGTTDSAAIYVARIGSADPESQRMLGVQLVASGRAAQAILLLEQSARALPTSSTFAELSLAYALSARGPEAEQAASVAAEHAPDSANVLTTLARAMYHAGRDADARTFLTRALVLDPTNSAEKAVADTLARGRRAH